jgi:sphinganine-1-phosphate aldolase
VRVFCVPVDPHRFRADPDAMAAAIDSDTVLVVASAPSSAADAIGAIGSMTPCA